MSAPKRVTLTGHTSRAARAVASARKRILAWSVSIFRDCGAAMAPRVEACASPKRVVVFFTVKEPFAAN
jgi:hypothetical protein